MVSLLKTNATAGTKASGFWNTIQCYEGHLNAFSKRRHQHTMICWRIMNI